MTFMRFQFDEAKGVEALAYIADAWPGITPFFASKVLFFAEKAHLNQYGRPIVADTFIAMPHGPVPSTLYDFIKGKLEFSGDPEEIQRAIRVSRGGQARISAKRKPRLDCLSATDVECLNRAIEFCRDKPFGQLSDLTHRERAWSEASPNSPMDYALMIDDDNPHREAIMEEAETFSAYGVL